MTKMDGDSRGGAAPAMKVTGGHQVSEPRKSDALDFPLDRLAKQL